VKPTLSLVGEKVGARVSFKDVLAEYRPLEGVVTSGPSAHGYCDVKHAHGSVIRHTSKLIFLDELGDLN